MNVSALNVTNLIHFAPIVSPFILSPSYDFTCQGDIFILQVIKIYKSLRICLSGTHDLMLYLVTSKRQCEHLNNFQSFGYFFWLKIDIKNSGNYSNIQLNAKWHHISYCFRKEKLQYNIGQCYLLYIGLFLFLTMFL